MQRVQRRKERRLKEEGTKTTTHNTNTFLVASRHMEDGDVDILPLWDDPFPHSRTRLQVVCFFFVLEFLSFGGMASIGNARVAASPIAGKGLFASADIKAGELIFTLARPGVAALDTVNLDTVCSNCFVSAAEPSILYGGVQEAVTVKACAGCKTLCYCSKVR